MTKEWYNQIIQHDATKKFPLPDNCIDVCITSPPYWGLRDYGIKGQIGLEKHPQEYIDKMVLVCQEIKRVLKKSGSFYLNLGDTYCGYWGNKNNDGTGYGNIPVRCYNQNKRGKLGKIKSNWIQPKQLMLIPSRVAIALQEDGWILRNDIIWKKPNPMPSSVKDRLNNTFEHVFHFVKSRKYYYDLDAIREPHAQSGIERRKYPHASWETKEDTKTSWVQTKDNEGRKIVPLNPLGKNPGDVIKYDGKSKGKDKHYQNICERKNYERQVLGIPHDLATSHPLGKNPGDFWNICTQPFTSYNSELEHFAVFPEELVIKPIKSSCPKDGVVLDPFGGRGTVGRVAKQLGLNYVLFDIKPEYCELARLYIDGQKTKLIKHQKKLKF